MDMGSTTGIAVVWGGMLAAAMILYGIAFRITKVHYSSRWSWGFYILPPAVALWVQLRYGGEGEAFGPDLALAAMVIGAGCIAYGLFVFAYNRFVDDSLIRQVVADRLKQLEVRSTDPEKLARSTARLKRFEHPAPFAASVTLSLIVVSMVIATMASLLI